VSLKNRRLALILAAALALTGAALRAPAQRRSPRRASSRAAEPAATPAPAPQKAATRPETQNKANTRQPPAPAVSDASAAKEDPNAPRYFYEFENPDFFVYFIHIEHDEAGRGLIRFERRSDTEQLTEPFELSPAALARVRGHWEALNFLDSSAQYQGERQYPSYGKSRLRMKRGERERTAEFNYAADPTAFALADEYRRAAEQAVLVFELTVALESQALETPKLIHKLETLVERKALSDPRQLLPLVRELAEDERVPLVGRNHAARILKKMEKQEK
jgi:hypothetical protein